MKAFTLNGKGFFIENIFAKWLFITNVMLTLTKNKSNQMRIIYILLAFSLASTIFVLAVAYLHYLFTKNKGDEKEI